MLLQIPSMSHGYPVMNITFPLNLSDGKVRESVTVKPDINGDDPQGVGPSFIQILSAGISEGVTDHTPYNLTRDLSKIPHALADLVSH